MSGIIKAFVFALCFVVVVYADCNHNGVCDYAEGCASCPDDCGSCRPENDCTGGVEGMCEPEETCSSCPQDCSSCDFYNQCNSNGVCDDFETCVSCPNDCPICAPDNANFTVVYQSHWGFGYTADLQIKNTVGFTPNKWKINFFMMDGLMRDVQPFGRKRVGNHYEISGTIKQRPFLPGSVIKNRVFVSLAWSDVDPDQSIRNVTVTFLQDS